MRLTVGKKTSAILMTVLLLGIGGAIVLATQLFTSDMIGLLKKDTLDVSALLAGRMQAEMRVLAERAQFLGAASLEEFRYPEDRLAFLNRGFSNDTRHIALSLYRRSGAVFEPEWRILHPEVKQLHRLATADIDSLDKSAPLDFESLSGGKVDFRVATLKGGLPVLRIAIPLVKAADSSTKDVLVIDVNQERLAAVFSESTQMTTFLLDRHGIVLGSSDPKAIPLGTDLSASAIAKAVLKSTLPAGQIDYTDFANARQMAGHRQVGFAGLTIISQVPAERALVAAKKLQRRTIFLGAAFLFLTLGLGLSFSRSLTSRIALLGAAAERIRTGDFSARIKTKESKDGRIVGDEIHTFTATFNQMAQGLSEREKMRQLIEKFHNKEVADKLLSGNLQLRGDRLDAVVLFSDLRDFTMMSETTDPERIVAILNRYLSSMVDIIIKHGGIVDKYVGDSIMAVWGVPEPSERDAENAVFACLDMRRALAKLNAEFIQEKLEPLKMGMALNSGPLIAGTIGSEERMEYTVIGDTVNTASRIEGLTKVFGTDLLISESVQRAVSSKFLFEPIENVAIRGKQEAANVYKVGGYFKSNQQPVLVETPYSSWPKNEEVAKRLQNRS